MLAAAQIPVAVAPARTLRARNRAAQRFLMQLTTSASGTVVFMPAPADVFRWADFEDTLQATCPAIRIATLNENPSFACKPFRDTAAIWLFEGVPLLENGIQLENRQQALIEAVERACTSGAGIPGIALPSAGPSLTEEAIRQDVQDWYALTATIGQHVRSCPDEVNYFHPAHSWVIRNEGS